MAVNSLTSYFHLKSKPTMPLKVITNFQEHQLESRNWARAEIYDFGVDLDY